jgi:hypothetical protein
MAAVQARHIDLNKAHPDAVIAHAMKLMESRLQRHDPALDSPQAVRDYLRLRIADREHEPVPRQPAPVDRVRGDVSRYAGASMTPRHEQGSGTSVRSGIRRGICR